MSWILHLGQVPIATIIRTPQYGSKVAQETTLMIFNNHEGLSHRAPAIRHARILDIAIDV
jgi:hypothetical protein